MASYNKLTTRHNAGVFIEISGESDKFSTNEDAIQCIHCGFTWVLQLNSGRERGWCMNCLGPTCGKERCETVCQHIEAFIEAIEAKSRIKENIDRLWWGS